VSYIKKSKKNGKIYLSEVESVRVNGKVITKHLRYIGKEVDGKTIISSSIQNLEIKKVNVYGPLIVLNHIAKEIKLSNMLGKHGDEILSMVFAHCLNFESINRMPDWFKRTDLNLLLDIDNLTESRLLSALDHLEKQDPILLQKKIFDKVSRRYRLSKKGLIYDVTNTYFYGNKCILSKAGKDKEGVKGRPLIQIGLGVTQKEGIPALHKVFHGNIHDSRSFQDIITTLESYNIKDGLIVFDRGVSSSRNQVDIKEMKWKVLCGLPIQKKLKTLLKTIVKENDFLHIKNRVKLNKTIFYVITVSYEISGIVGKLAFCYNEKKSRELKESRYDEIEEAKLLLKKRRKIKVSLEGFFSSDGKLLMKKVKEAEETDGYMAIFTTATFSKEEMVRLYFDKDVVEKAFRSLKGITKLRPIRHWLYNRVICHIYYYLF
jgi:transposase